MSPQKSKEKIFAFQSLEVYCFSGTGNSQNVALWLTNEASKRGYTSKLVNIAITDRLHIEAPSDDALVVFVSPIHGFNYPPAMLHFIMRFAKGKNNVVLMNTRAGMLIGRWITPGLTGIAFLLSSLILWLKGYKIKGTMPVDMPSNWISVHPGLNKRTIEFLHNKNKERVTRFAEIILTGKSKYNGRFEIVQDLLIAPISLGYYLIGRLIIAKTYYASSNCNNCNLCLKQCPVKAIIKVDKRPYWTYNCESCMHCMSYCPQKAIETAHGSFVLFAILSSSIPFALLNNYFENNLIPISNEILRFILESIIFLFLFGIWYRIIHYMLRYRWFERLVVYTSLTKYKWWGRRYKAIKDQ